MLHPLAFSLDFARNVVLPSIGKQSRMVITIIIAPNDMLNQHVHKSRMVYFRSVISGRTV